MRCPLGVLLCLLFTMLTAACGSSSYYATASPATKPGLRLEAERGLASEELLSMDPAQSPLAGAFFADGGNDDVRARSENRFGRSPDDSGSAANPQPIEPPRTRMLIYQGEIAVEVARPEESIQAFLARVADWGGYMQSQVDTTVTVRVPAEHFASSFESLRAAGRVLREERRTQDVTEEFLDVEIRLGNARNSRDRLLEILKQADKVEDILKIEEQLRRLTDEIETMEGRRKFLADQVALATLKARFQAVSAPPPVPHRRQPSRFAWINLIGPERVMEDF